MKKLIYLKVKENQKISLNILKKSLNINFDDLLKYLKELEDENLIMLSINNYIYLIGDKYKKGVIKINDKKFGFVNDFNNNEVCYFVPPNSINKSISYDQVAYKIIKEDQDRYKAIIIDIIQREKKYLVGEIEENNKYLDFVSSDPLFKNYRIVMVNACDFNLKKEDLLKVKILNVKDNKLFVRIVKIFGKANKAADRIISIAYENNVKTEFNELTLSNAKQVAVDIDYNDYRVKRRMNNLILDKLLVTIDGEDSKDLDDAICVEKINDSYKLIVAIADVSHYVDSFSPLDKSALQRGNSTYLANKVLPMLPEQLSNGVCSLNPNEKKLCMVAEMLFDCEGNILKSKIYESIMISKARLTYKEVNEFYDKNIFNKNNDIADMLRCARQLHEIIEKVKFKKGTIDFDIAEPKVILDENSNVVDIQKRARGISERLIENFMVCANECVASKIYEKNLPFVYRNHDLPNEENLIEWHNILKTLGINVKLNELDKKNPKTINKALMEIASQIKDETEREVINVTLLKYMPKALYELENIGHFGLASNCYTHFTSPIRRYSDLMVHRYLKQYLIKKDLRTIKLEKNKNFITKACLIINETEKNSVNAEREVNKVCMAEFMTNKINQEFDGVISAVLKFGLFVQLENCVEGLVHISKLPNFNFDEKANILINENNIIYRLGQKIRIKVTNADIKKRIIDFELV